MTILSVSAEAEGHGVDELLVIRCRVEGYQSSRRFISTLMVGAFVEMHLWYCCHFNCDGILCSSGSLIAPVSMHISSIETIPSITGTIRWNIVLGC